MDKHSAISSAIAPAVQDRLQLSELDYQTLRCAQLCKHVELALGTHHHEGRWRSRALALFVGVAQALCYLRDRGLIRLDAKTLKDGLAFAAVQKLIWKGLVDAGGQLVRIDDAWFSDVVEPLKQFVEALPGCPSTADLPVAETTLNQYGYLYAMLVSPPTTSARSAFQ